MKSPKVKAQPVDPYAANPFLIFFEDSAEVAKRLRVPVESLLSEDVPAVWSHVWARLDRLGRAFMISALNRARYMPALKLTVAERRALERQAAAAVLFSTFDRKTQLRELRDMWRTTPRARRGDKRLDVARPFAPSDRTSRKVAA